MNNPRRIQRHLVKALAAGALLAAAALPMALATSAGALSTPGTVTAAAFQVTNVAGGTNTSSFGTGASGTVLITGTGFADDGGNVTVTSNAPGLTFTGATESSATQATASFASTSATVPGSYGLTVTDDAGAATGSGLFTVNAAPSITSISPTTISDGNGPTLITLTGSGFTTGDVVTLTSDVNGTAMTVSSPATVAAGGTSETVTVTPTNPITSGQATAGTFDVTATNLDGGTTTASSGLTVTAYGITNASPSALPNVGASGPFNTTVTLSGAGFEYGATVAVDAACTSDGVTLVGGTTVAGESTAVANVASATSLSVVVTNDDTNDLCDLTVTNPTTGGNGATFVLDSALGIGEASDVAPTITASSLSTGTALNAGDPSTVVTFTGTGFSQYTEGASLWGASAADTDADATITGCTGNSGTSLTCQVTVYSGAHAGSHIGILYNTDPVAASNYILNAFTVAGPVIASAAPAALAVGAAVGTVVTLTGTGFTNTTTGTQTEAGSLRGVFQYVSATTEDFVVTTSPDAADVAGPDSLSLTSVNGNGATVVTPPFALSIDSAPTVSGLTYGVTGTTDVGVGATAQPITITGTGFQPGATVTGFANGNGTADPNVTVTVTGVNLAGTQITGTVAVAAGDTNPAVGYTVTNTDGGTATVPAIAGYAIVLGAGPTITAVSPTPALAAATNAFTITGTGFQSGAVVSATANGTCGTATVAPKVAPATTSTSITVSCTLGVTQASASTSLVVTNPDGGSATSAVVLAAGAPPVKKPAFKVGATHGTAVAGKTVTLRISGSGFYGAPRITSSAPGTRAKVSKDNGKMLTVRVTTKAGTRAGTKTFTVRLANGKSGKTNYKVRG